MYNVASAFYVRNDMLRTKPPLTNSAGRVPVSWLFSANAKIMIFKELNYEIRQSGEEISKNLITFF